MIPEADPVAARHIAYIAVPEHCVALPTHGRAVAPGVWVSVGYLMGAAALSDL